MRSNIKRRSRSILSVILAAAMVMGLSGTTSLAAEDGTNARILEEAQDAQTILVRSEVSGTVSSDTAFSYWIEQVTEAAYPIQSVKDDIISSAPGADLSYTVYDIKTQEEVRTDTTDTDGSFSLYDGEYASFSVEAGTDWYVAQDTPEAYPLLSVSADGDHAFVAEDIYGVVQYEAEGEETVSADKSALQAEYDTDSDLEEADYTPESWEVFENAMERAKDVLDDPDATQEEVDSALADLQEAKEGLIKQPEKQQPDASTIDVTVEKIWEDHDDQDGIRPASITVDLLENGEVKDSASMTETDGWTFVFDGLPAYDESGEEITYAVEEPSVPAGYAEEVTGDMESGYTITNTHIPETVSITGTKTWEDNDNQDGVRPASVDVLLLADGNVKETHTVTAADDWTFTFGEQPKYDSGDEVTYDVIEVVPDGYSATYRQVTDASGNLSFTVTNAHTPETTSLTVSKVWEDRDDQDGIRPESVTVTLLCDGETATEEKTNEPCVIILSDDNQWSDTFTDLPKYQYDGATGETKTHTYTIEEIAVDGYTSTIEQVTEEAYVCRNEHTPETIAITGEKIWEDDNDRDRLRPDSVEIHLLADGTEVNAQTVSDDTNWQFAFDELGRNAAGREIHYTLTETMPGNAGEYYEAGDFVETAEHVYTVTNTHAPALYNGDGILRATVFWPENAATPASVTATLLKDGEEALDQNGEPVTATLTGDEWSGAFEGLFANEDGEAIDYSVAVTSSEPADALGLYAPEITKNSDGSITITMHQRYYELDEEIVDSESDRDSWKKSESVNEYNAIGIEMSTMLPYMEGSALADGSYSLVFHDELDSALLLDEDSADFTVTIGEREIDPAYYTITLADGAELSPYTDYGDDCTFHVAVDLTGLYRDGMITDGDLTGETEIMLFFFADLEGTGLNGTYTSTAWYEVHNDGNVLFTSSQDTVSVYTYEIRITKYDAARLARGEDAALSGAEFAIFYDADCTKAVSRNKEDYTATSGENGLVDFYGLAEGTYYIKETAAPYGWRVSDEILEVTLDESLEGRVCTDTLADTELYSPDNPPSGYEPGTITVTKVWRDGGNADGARPESVAIELLANDTCVEQREISGTEPTAIKPCGGIYRLLAADDNEWTVTFTDLPKYDADGVEIEYTVAETDSEAMSAYESRISYPDGADCVTDGTATITNTELYNRNDPSDPDYDPSEAGRLTITKVWKDGGSMERPPISVALMNGEETLKEVDNAAWNKEDENIWTYTFYNLPKYDSADQKIDYAVSEEAVDGYMAEIDGFTVTNTSDAAVTATIVLTLTDTDDDIPLTGAVFDLYWDGGLYKSGLTTDENGKITVEDLDYGEYYFVETAAPDGYVLPEDPKTESVVVSEETMAESDGTFSVNVANEKYIPEPKATIVLTLTDDNAWVRERIPLSGASFTLYRVVSDGNDEVIGAYTTDEDGMITVDDLGYGEYYFVETATLDRYVLPEDPKTETVVISAETIEESGGTFSVTVLNGVSETVRYAVRVWGIDQDTYSTNDGKILRHAGLTFGPATGADHLDSYVSRETVIADGGTHDSTYCIHDMSWDEIIAQSKEDPYVFADCKENGCTKAVELTPNKTLFNMDTVENYRSHPDLTGDGVSTLYYLLNGTGDTSETWGANWNYSYNYSSVDDMSNIYSRSRVRATLTGDSADARARVDAGGEDFYGLNSICNENNCLLSCFPENLREAIVPRTTVNTGNSEKTGTYWNGDPKTTYDKLFLFSVREIGCSYEYDDGGGEDYGANNENADRKAYEFDGTDAAASSSSLTWWLRSRSANDDVGACDTETTGSAFQKGVNTHAGLSPGFSLPGPSAEDEAAIILTLTDDNKEESERTPLNGGVFALYRVVADGEDELLDTYTTDEAGVITAEGLPYGEYYFVETTAPDGYLLPEETKTATVVISEETMQENNGEFYLAVENERVGTIRYAVKVWGIEQDTYSEDGGKSSKTAGLTFGPATGAERLDSYVSRETVLADGGTHASTYCIHDMSWDDIIAQSKEDPYVFADCMENGCTKAVELTPNKTLFNLTTVANYQNNASYTGDGVSTLCYLLNGVGSGSITYSATWNYIYAIGSGPSASDPANIYSRSRIRTTLTGDQENINAWMSEGGHNNYYYAENSPLCDTTNALLSCFPNSLQEAMVPRTTSNAGNAQTGSYQNADTKTTYDKLFLFSMKETGVTDYRYDDGGGDDYGVNGSADDRIAYEFSDTGAAVSSSQLWWSRSRYSGDNSSAVYVTTNGTGSGGGVEFGRGLSPGFCLPGPESVETEKWAFAVYCKTDNSLTFYADSTVPEEGDIYKEKVVTNVYDRVDSLSASFNNYSNIIPWYDLRADITSVVIDDSFKSVQPIRLSYWFYMFTNATFSGFENLDTSKVDMMRDTFYNCYCMTSLDISDWVTSRVSSMYGTFYGCSALTELDVSNWDTSRVTSMQSMFYNCSSLTELDVSQWDTSSLSTVESLFRECSALTSIDLSRWDVSGVSSTAQMFQACTNLKSIDVSGWDTSNMTDMSYTFNGCSSLESLSVSGWDTSSVTDMRSLFNACESLKSLDVSGWNTPSVSRVSNMFQNCKSLESLDLSGWNTSKVSSTDSTVTYRRNFATGCSSLEWIKIGSSFDLFTKISDAPVSQQNWYDSDKYDHLISDNFMIGVTNANSGNSSGQYWCEMTVTGDPFAIYSSYDNSLTFYYGDIPNTGSNYNGKVVTNVYTGVESTGTSNPPWYSIRTSITSVEFDKSFTYAHPTSCYNWFNGSSNLVSVTGEEYLDTAEVTNMYHMFYNCTALPAVDLSSWDVSKVTTMNQMFYKDAALTTVGDLSNWNTAALENPAGLFYDCTALAYVGDLSGWIMDNATTIAQIFYDCESLPSVGELDNWKTGNATSMASLFYHCYVLESVGDLSGWDTSKVTGMANMFANCYELTDLSFVANWNTESATAMGSFFRNCTGLTSIDVSGWNTKNVTSCNNFAAGLSDDFDWIMIGDNFDLFEKNTSKIVDQKSWYDNDVNGNLVSNNYMIGVTNANSGNTSGQYWTYTN